MSKDSTYYAYIAEEVSVQRNGALDELAAARTENRLANITIASLETELFHVKSDLGAVTGELDYLTESIEGLQDYLEYLEKNANEAMALSNNRLRQRIENLEAENARLENLLNNGVRFVTKPNVVTNIDMEPYYDESYIEAEGEPENTPSSLILPTFTEEEMQALIEGIALPPSTNVTPPIVVTGIGAPGQAVAINNEVKFGSEEAAAEVVNNIVVTPDVSKADFALRALIQANGGTPSIPDPEAEPT